jgi:hypothetical protein
VKKNPRLCAMNKSRMRLVRLLRKLSTNHPQNLQALCRWSSPLCSATGSCKSLLQPWVFPCMVPVAHIGQLGFIGFQDYKL